MRASRCHVFENQNVPSQCALLSVLLGLRLFSNVALSLTCKWLDRLPDDTFNAEVACLGANISALVPSSHRMFALALSGHQSRCFWGRRTGQFPSFEMVK